MRAGMKRFVEKNQILLFFSFSLLIGYSPWYITGKPIWLIYGMPISGILLTSLVKGLPGLASQIKSAINIRVPAVEYLKVIALLVFINVLTLFIAFILFDDIPTLKMLRTEPSSIPKLLLIILLGGPIVEEVFGLRGFALPELLKKHSPLLSSCTVGFFFGAWHLIEFFRPGSTQNAIGLTYYPLFILAEIAASILMTHYYIRNKHSLLLAGIFFHWMMNNAVILFQTDLVLSQIQSAPRMNTHYFVIYSILLCLAASFVVLRFKLHIKLPYARA